MAKVKVLGCLGVVGDINRCDECGFTFNEKECLTYKWKCNRKLVFETLQVTV